MLINGGSSYRVIAMTQGRLGGTKMNREGRVTSPSGPVDTGRRTSLKGKKGTPWTEEERSFSGWPNCIELETRRWEPWWNQISGPRFDPSSEANIDLPVLLRPHGSGRASFPFFKA